MSETPPHPTALRRSPGRSTRRPPTAVAAILTLILGACSFNLDALPGGGNDAAPTATSPTLVALNESIAANPNNPDALHQRGLLVQAEGRHEPAIADFSVAIGLSARQPGALVARATSYLAIGQTIEAATDLDEAVRLDPDNAAIWVLRGEAYEKLAATDKAAGSYDRALAISPGNAEAQAGLARVGGAAGRRSDHSDASAIARNR
jgi:tetratricopeptide (TPR) repeat protein